MLIYDNVDDLVHDPQSERLLKDGAFCFSHTVLVHYNQECGAVVSRASHLLAKDEAQPVRAALHYQTWTAQGLALQGVLGVRVFRTIPSHCLVDSINYD